MEIIIIKDATPADLARAIAGDPAVLASDAVANTPDRVLTVEQVGEMLQVTRSTVYDRAIDLGGFHLGSGTRGVLRFTESGVRAYMEKRKAALRDHTGDEVG